jgi:hypothetical protein
VAAAAAATHTGGALTRWAPTNAAPRSRRLRRSKRHVNCHCPPEPRLVAANNRAMWEASTRPVQCGAWHANSEYLRRRSKRGRDIRHTSPKMLRIVAPRVKSGVRRRGDAGSCAPWCPSNNSGCNNACDAKHTYTHYLGREWKRGRQTRQNIA